jgi:SAM-dependent methyltransferase
MTAGWRQILQRRRRPAPLGALRRLAPISDVWGFDRGTPVDRFYIERFLDRHSSDIRGRVLEVQSSVYAKQYGRAVERFDVLDLDPLNRQATIVADLTEPRVPSDSFDCFILTQTLHLIYDVRAALFHAHRMLAPGGVLLASVPALSRISRGAGVEGDFWRFTTASFRRLVEEVFPPQNVSVASYGSALTAIAFLAGLAQEELRRDELEAQDDFFPVLVAARAVKA